MEEAYLDDGLLLPTEATAELVVLGLLLWQKQVAGVALDDHKRRHPRGLTWTGVGKTRALRLASGDLGTSSLVEETCGGGVEVCGCGSAGSLHSACVLAVCKTDHLIEASRSTVGPAVIPVVFILTPLIHFDTARHSPRRKEWKKRARFEIQGGLGMHFSVSATSNGDETSN